MFKLFIEKVHISQKKILFEVFLQSEKGRLDLNEKTQSYLKYFQSFKKRFFLKPASQSTINYY